MAKQFALNNVITSIFLIPEIPKNAAKIRNIPHIRNNYSEKSTRFNAPPPFPSETTTRITESPTIFTDGGTSYGFSSYLCARYGKRKNFEYPQHFSRLFKSRTGMTPNAYRLTA